MKNLVTKRVFALMGASILSVGLLAGCGSSNDSNAEPAANPVEPAQSTENLAETEQADAETTQAAEPAGAENKGTITVAASATPHAEILEKAAPILAEQGWTLDVTVFDDYILPNNVVESEEFNANYFQHIPYLDSFNAEQGTHLVNAGGIHYEPFGIYPGTKSDLSELADGDTIAVPNDTSNEARALLLLEAQGLIKLKEGAGLTATKNDIVENPKNIKLYEVEAAQIPRSIDDVDVAVINGNYAIDAGFKMSDALAVEALTSDEVKAFMETTYEGAVVPLD